MLKPQSRGLVQKLDMTWRLLLGLVMGYGLCWGLVMCLCGLLPLMHQSKATTWYLTSQLVPLPLLLTTLWVFIQRDPTRAIAWPMALGLTLNACAHLGHQP